MKILMNPSKIYRLNRIQAIKEEMNPRKVNWEGVITVGFLTLAVTYFGVQIVIFLMR